MLVEAALEHFLNPAPSVEALMRERLDDMHARFDDLQRDMRMTGRRAAADSNRRHDAVIRDSATLEAIIRISRWRSSNLACISSRRSRIRARRMGRVQKMLEGGFHKHALADACRSVATSSRP